MTALSNMLNPRLSRRELLALGAAAGLLPMPFLRISQASAQETVSTGFLAADALHSIEITFDQTLYDAMIATYSETGDKDWLEGTAIIDGIAYEQIGMRLKGNSSLGGLRSRGSGDQPSFDAQGGGGDPALDATPSAGMADLVVIAGPMGNVSADKPETLPWLLRLDKYIDAQNHLGITNIVIRSNNSETALNEALALDLLAAAGLASQQAAYSSLVVNGSEPALRLAIELPDDLWLASHFDPAGVLFKSESTGDWSNRGTDPKDYDDVFDLEAGGDGDEEDDFQPLFSFLEYVNDSDDTAFAAEFENRVNVDAFVTYLAMMTLINNFDDIDGPGNNSYLYFAPETGQLTVVPWDMNLAFGGLGMGGGGMTGGPGQNGGLNGDPQFQRPSGEGMTIDGTPIAGDGIQVVRRGGDGAGGGPGGMSNPLVSRTANLDGFSVSVDERLAALKAELYEGGVAETILARWTTLLTTSATGLVDAATITTESTSLADYIKGG